VINMSSFLVRIGMITMFSVLLNAQDKVVVIGQVKPGIDVFTPAKLFFGNNQSADCGYQNENIRNFLCSSTIPVRTTSLRVEVRSKGYKTFTVNVPQLTFVKGVATVNIGAVTLIESELPTIENVLAGHANGKRAFYLTLQNKLPRDILVKRLRITGFGQSGGPRGLCYSIIAQFKITNSLIITAGRNGALNAAGEYVESVQGITYPIRTKGTISTESCGATNTILNLEAPVSFVIPKDSFSGVQIVMPERFHFDKPIAREVEARLNNLSSFSFYLSTDERDELDIEGSIRNSP
jgi:hypothetical protein